MLDSWRRLLAQIGGRISRHGLDEFLRLHLGDTGGLILDVGCGGRKIAGDAKNWVIGLDVNPGSGIDVVGDAHCLPFRDDTFDAIVCVEVLEHLQHPHTAVAELYRISKPGAKVLVCAPFYFPPHLIPIDYFRFTKHGLEILFGRWSEVNICIQYGLLGTMAVHLVRLSMAHSLAILVFSPLLAGLALLFMYLDQILRRCLRACSSNSIEFVTTNYFLVATKRSNETKPRCNE